MKNRVEYYIQNEKKKRTWSALEIVALNTLQKTKIQYLT